MTDYKTLISQANPNDLPLIATSKGNLPVDALEYITEWVTETTYIMFNEKWLLDGEVVKSNSHTYTHNPFGAIGSETATF